MIKKWVRVKINQRENKIAIIRIYIDDEKHIVKKECLNNSGEWIEIQEMDHYLWDEIKDIHYAQISLIG